MMKNFPILFTNLDFGCIWSDLTLALIIFAATLGVGLFTEISAMFCLIVLKSNLKWATRAEGSVRKF